MMAVFVAQLGLSPETFWDLTPAETTTIMYYHRQKQKTEIALQYNAARAIAFHTLSPHLKKGADVKPEDLLPYPFDLDEKPKKLSRFIKGEKAAQLTRLFKTDN